MSLVGIVCICILGKLLQNFDAMATDRFHKLLWENACEQRNFLIFCWIFMKRADNNDKYKISDEFESGKIGPTMAELRPLDCQKWPLSTL